MTFNEWWVSEFGRPPLPGENKLLEHCLSAFNAAAGDSGEASFEEKREQLAEINEEITLFDGYEDALVGTCVRFGMEPIAIYDLDQCIDGLMKDGLSYEEADEHFHFNTLGAWVGDLTPAFLKRFECRHERRVQSPLLYGPAGTVLMHGPWICQECGHKNDSLHQR